ncbi:MAG TPA: hypothetical protein C5S51_11280 [Methanosarcinaceae archaeon]|nr:hypothetical protein [Methanosarcinaceae archaeon]
MEYFILNEHSLPIARDIEDRCLNQFFDVYKEAMNRDFKQILISNNVDPNWYEIPTFEGRTIRSWINEQSRDYATRVKSLIQSIERPELRMEDIQGPDVSKFYYNGNSVKLLGAAYLLKQLAFSFGSDEMWNEPFFLLECEELVSNDIKVSNVTTREHWDIYFGEILEERRKQALSSDDIEKRLKGEFPNIIFTNDASKQIKNEHSPVFLGEIWYACKKLNEVVERVGDQVSYHHVISETDLEITDESSTVKNNRKLERYRMKMYDGKRRFFAHHIKNFSGAKRVHFIIDDGKIVIGYLGKHLPL